MVSKWVAGCTCAIDESGVGLSPQTRFLRSSDSVNSRSTSKLLHMQKTELFRLSTVCSEKPGTMLT